MKEKLLIISCIMISLFLLVSYTGCSSDDGEDIVNPEPPEEEDDDALDVYKRQIQICTR